MQKHTQNGRESACPPKRSGSLPHAEVSRASHSSGATSFIRMENGWRILIKATFPIPIPAMMDSLEPLPSGTTLQTDTACMTWPAMSGSGPPIGTVLTIIPNSLQPAPSAATPKGLLLHLIPPNRVNRKRSSVEVRIYVQTSTVPVTSWAHGAKAKSVPERITLVFDA